MNKSKFGRILKISRVCRCGIKTQPHQFLIPNRREHVYKKAVQECIKAGEIMKKVNQITYSQYPKVSINPYFNRFLSDEGDFCRNYDENNRNFLYKTDCGGDFRITKVVVSDFLRESRREKSTDRPSFDNPCDKYKNKDKCGKKEDPCKKKEEDPCKKKKEDPCKKKEDPCKKKEDPCKKKEDPCKKKEDPCKKKKEDPCKKKEDPCKKKKEDPCKKKKEDPCKKKKEDPCKKKKEDPCKKKEDPCKKKKEDPCKKKKEDPCKKKKDDPCKKAKEDPCKKKDDPCKKAKEDPCKKKDDPCKKPKLCSAHETTPKECESTSVEPCEKKKESKSYPLINGPCPESNKDCCEASQENQELPNILDEIDVLDPTKLANAEETFGEDYKNKEYHSYTNFAFYDMNSYLSCQRSEKPGEKESGDKCD
ncbi:hypothetical protein TcasGA2_TC015757 [Tribolium castaneum]|uniref:Uncharacterized protein n=1 Tax=Tribolium castaneum TaxID=7070 RepID=D2A3T8_TRICA|nr:PREDICTED: vicilin-like seed storage protein At2g18540 [Tribolium castaneum]EFA05568.1 hypothetical protein TcasGA2_TC015757 [Tribolium castaneum]|eukprot:XP_008194913.1 PREDICTED: vicilin-like seed storage protein At2g18540 [Tribolium castaneum]